MGENVVATSQPLAAQAGLRMLLEGGNAVDAAVAAAVTLTVVEPTGNGIGSDAFALIWDGRKLYGLNGSGRSPRAWDLKRFEGHTKMPQYGWDSVTVPGAVDLWATLWRRFGRLSASSGWAARAATICTACPRIEVALEGETNRSGPGGRRRGDRGGTGRVGRDVAAGPAQRPAGDYTPRIIPALEGAAVPIEISRILWYR